MDANTLPKYEPTWANMAHPGEWRKDSYGADAVAKMIRRIHVYTGNPESKSWHMSMDCAVAIPGHNNAVGFQRDVPQAFQHVSRGIWGLPTDCYKRVRDGIIVCRPFPEELTKYRREFVMALVSRNPAVTPCSLAVKLLEYPRSREDS